MSETTNQDEASIPAPVSVDAWRKSLVAVILLIAVTSVGSAFAAYRSILDDTDKRTAYRLGPLEQRVAFGEVQLLFVVTEVREIRVEQRASAAKGPAAVELFRPMAPLPQAPDGGL